MIETKEKLNKLFKVYTGGNLSKKEFENILFRYILKHPGCIGIYGVSRSECADILCVLYPRISRCIEKYDISKGSLTTYLNSIVRFACKEQRAEFYKNREYDYYFADNAAKSMELMESEAVYSPFYGENDAGEEEKEDFLGRLENACKSRKSSLKKMLPDKKQLLVLVLKSYYFAGEKFVAEVADYLNIPPAELLRKLESLHFLRLEKEEAIAKIQEMYYKQNYRCKVFERRLRESENGSLSRFTLASKLDVCKRRLNSLRERYHGARREASNSEIAKVLGMSKGSVDSSLFLAKRKCEEVMSILPLI